ncbi:recombinase family protein [Romboutsia maritimum]|uniref:Recombinase family protein n=1 Tax=Romboutsia maritimum TaxID=2020948 RepID=A0A371IQV0_9FIRM|nr:recombinase family protein [Romboutsia maritimum]RDY22844.1 recombinase family protein [Romboutsia maritimum]
MKAAIYSRKSKFTGKGESIENQIQLCMDYAKNVGIEDFLIYEDEGFSGSSTDRPKFKEMLKDAKDKKFDYLICYRLDRISRNVSDFSTLIEELNKLDISFISIKEQFDTSTPMGRAMMYISSVFAQLERETIAERIKDNMYELARTGRWLGGNPPVGFTSTKISYYDENMVERKMHKLEIDNDNIDKVKIIFDAYLELRSLSKLYKYLYNNDIRGVRDGRFSTSTVSKLLRSPAYVRANKDVIEYLQSKNFDVVGIPDNNHGILTYAKNSDTPIAAIAKHEGIIDADSWLKVQRLMDRNKDKAPRNQTSNKALLAGLIRCSKCKSNMRISFSETSSGSKKYYYICGTKKTLGVSVCDCKNIKADIAEEKVINEIKNTNVKLLINSYKQDKQDSNKDFKTIDNKLNLLNSNIKEKQNMINNLIVQLGKNTDSTASTYIINKIEELNKEIENLKQELEIVQSASTKVTNINLNLDIIIDNLNRFNAEIDTSDLDRKRFLLSNIIESIDYVSDYDKMIINYIGLKKN